MVNARTRFLNGDWYAPLREFLCRCVELHTGENPVLIDAGCGEGYYTASMAEAVSAKNGRSIGVDLSKAAVRRAARRCPHTEIAVASVYHLPIGDACADVLVDCFSPLAEEEFVRVLRPGGLFVYVVPGPRHLWELKQILYENPYENTLRDEQYPGFRQMEAIPIEFGFHLGDPEDIAALFHMTPYTWKTPRDGAERLNRCQELDVTAQFRILMYQKTR